MTIEWTEVRSRVVGIGGTAFCATQSMHEIDPGTAATHPSDWGPAIVSMADHYPWLEDSTRIIVPVSNQGPEDGNPVEDPGVDRNLPVQDVVGDGISAYALSCTPAARDRPRG